MESDDDLMPTKPQEITIELIEKESRLTGESFAVAVSSLVDLLRSVDSRMWTVNAPRYRWVIKSVEMKSPLKLTLEAILTNQDAPNADVVGNTIRGLGQLDSGRAKRPKFFDEEGLALSKRMVSVFSDGVLAMNLMAPEREEIRPSTRIARAVERIIERAPNHPFDAYGSIDGVIRRVTLDNRPSHEVSELQIIDLRTDRLVSCVVNPETAKALTDFLLKRIIVYGTIRYDSDHMPVKIRVDDFEPILSEPIPTLEQLHDLHINITGGEDAADYIARMRGDDD